MEGRAIPRDGSGVYSKPAGTTAVANTTIQSALFNSFADDVVNDLNTDRPIVAGGTGASTAAAARTNLELGNVDNTSDANKPVSTATQTALDLKADQSTTLTAGTGLTGGGDLSTNRTLDVDFASQAEAEAGTATDKPLNALRVNQAIQALAPQTGIVVHRGNRVDASGSTFLPTGSTTTILSMGSRAAANSANRIVVRASIEQLISAGGTPSATIGLYVGSTLVDSVTFRCSVTYLMSVNVEFEYDPGDTSSRSYSIRCQNSSGINITTERASAVLMEFAG